ncbi:MAG: glutathione S-transferase [Myxococcota bacterium]
MALRSYDFALSGHAHRVRLFASVLGLPLELVPVDLGARAHKTPEYLAMNPLGQVPVLVDGDLTLSDSNAILVYLALRYDPSGRWYPRDPAAAARIQRWLSVAAGELNAGPAAARRAAVFKAPIDPEPLRAAAHRLLAVIEAQLGSTPYLAGDGPTIADLAIYTYTAHAPEGGVSLDGYPAIRAWLGRIEALPGFVPMPRAG